MIPVPMAPDNAVNFTIVHATLFQDLIDAFRDIQSWNAVFYRGLGSRRVIPPVFSAAEVEHDRFSKLLVLDKEGEGGQVHVFMAFLNWLHECFGRDDYVSGRVDDVYLDGGIRLREVERRDRLGLNVLVGHGCWINFVDEVGVSTE